MKSFTFSLFNNTLSARFNRLSIERFCHTLEKDFPHAGKSIGPASVICPQITYHLLS